jgi:2-polyprenyl-3-methyl-5-hydroxy-6-metoxy-1,4-benzoquinol methylase
MCGAAGSVKYPQVRDFLFGVEGSWDLRSCERAECSCLWLDPCPVPEDIGKAYETYYTHGTRAPWLARALETGWGLAGRAYLGSRYRRSVAGLPQVAARIVGPLLRLQPEIYLHLALLLRHLPPPEPGQTLLDIGCGEGLALKVLSSVGWAVQGQDMDEQAVHAARTRGLRVHHGSLESCAFPSASFDAVTMSHVIEHVHDPEALFREIERILKPGGTLISVTPNVFSENHELFGRAWFHLDPPRHLLLFSAQALGALARRTGFATVQVTSSVRSNRVSEIAARVVMRDGRYAWGSYGTYSDRLTSAYHFGRSLLQRAGERLKGDELILSAQK